MSQTVVNSIVFASVELPRQTGRTSSVTHCRKSILLVASCKQLHNHKILGKVCLTKQHFFCTENCLLLLVSFIGSHFFNGRCNFWNLLPVKISPNNPHRCFLGTHVQNLAKPMVKRGKIGCSRNRRQHIASLRKHCSVNSWMEKITL